MKTVTTFYRRVIVFVRFLDEAIPDLQSDLSVRITMLTKDDLPAFHFHRPDQQMHIIQQRIERGDKCFVVWHEGLIVHSCWAATEQVHVPYLRRYLILKPGEISFYDDFTLPAYRNRNLAKTRGVYVFRHYLGLGYLRAIAVVALENKAGLRVPIALGYYPIGLYTCLRFGPCQWDWEKRWGQESLPTLTKMKISE
jgi:hypothetical protein